MIGEKIFTEVSEIINTDRQDQYGKPENSFDDIATRWSQFLRCRYDFRFELLPEDIAFMMADMKMARECHQKKRDNIIDTIGYLAIKDDLESDK